MPWLTDLYDVINIPSPLVPEPGIFC